MSNESQNASLKEKGMMYSKRKVSKKITFPIVLCVSLVQNILLQ